MPRAKAAPKEDAERKDLRIVLGSLLKDPELSSEPKAIDKYLDPDSKHLNIDNRNLDINKLFPLLLTPGAEFHIGGGGIVLECTNKEQPAIKYALKIPRPSLFQGSEERVRQNIGEAYEEFLKHSPLSHENVARVYGHGEINVTEPNGRSPKYDVILMEWIQGATPLNKYLIENATDYIHSIDLLSQCFRALAYIHTQDLIHWDIKSDNFLVNSQGTVKLTDIGNARYTKDPNRASWAYSTRGNPPEALKPLRSGKAGRSSLTSRRVAFELKTFDWDRPWLDLWMFARELNRLFRSDLTYFNMDLERAPSRDEFERRSDSFLQKFPSSDDDAGYARQFLNMIIRRLLKPELPTDPMCYVSSNEVVGDLAKLLPEFGGAHPVPELRATPQRVLRLPQSGNAPWTPRTSALFNTASLQRLRKHKQLGAVSQVYPGASHTRLEHVAGVMAATVRYIQALYSDRSEPFWRISVDARDIDSLLVAAMVHDIGHLAFGHYLEEMHGLFKGRTHLDYAVLLLDPDRAKSSVQLGAASLAEATRDRDIVKNVVVSKWGVDQIEADAFLSGVAEILVRRTKASSTLPTDMNAQSRETARAPWLNPETSKELKADVLHSIIDSAIDADKLDYLLRDAYHCGVHYAQGIDVDRFLQAMTAIVSFPPELADSKPRASIAVTERGILPVESMLIARYQLFSCVYWQHTARALTAMLQYLLLAYLEAFGSELDERLDDLMKQFRERNDSDALLWLKTELAKNRTLGTERAALLADIAGALMGDDRKLIYWPAYELPYDPDPGGMSHEIYAGLMEESRRAAAQETPRAYVDYSKGIRMKFITKLNGLVKNQKIEFLDGEILIDIPPAGKDQVDNVFVSDNENVRRIQDMSPLAGAVSDAFKLWVRKPRVFFSPGAWTKCEKGRLSVEAVKSNCCAVLEDLYVAQRTLKFKSQTEGTKSRRRKKGPG